MKNLTRRQHEIYAFLKLNQDEFPWPPTLSELCDAMGMKSKGSMHAQVQALIDAGLVEPMSGKKRGIRLTGVKTNTEIAIAVLNNHNMIEEAKALQELTKNCPCRDCAK